MTELNNLRAIRVVVQTKQLYRHKHRPEANIAKADGESQAIKIITSQLRQDPQYLQWQAINRWNGQMPYSLGGQGAIPFFQLPQSSSQSSVSGSQQQNQSKNLSQNYLSTDDHKTGELYQSKVVLCLLFIPCEQFSEPVVP